MGKKLKIDWKAVSVVANAVAAYLMILLTALLLVLLITGCSVKKKVSREDIQIEKTAIDKKKTGLESLEMYRGFFQTMMDSLKLDYRYSFKIYDTDKPIDEETHLPPLLAEFGSEMNLESGTNIDTKDSSEVVVNRELQEEFHKESNDSLSHKEDVEKSSKSKIGRDLVAAIILAIVMFVAAILSKLGIKEIFRKT